MNYKEVQENADKLEKVRELYIIIISDRYVSYKNQCLFEKKAHLTCGVYLNHQIKKDNRMLFHLLFGLKYFRNSYLHTFACPSVCHLPLLTFDISFLISVGFFFLGRLRPLEDNVGLIDVIFKRHKFSFTMDFNYYYLLSVIFIANYVLETDV